MSWHMLFDVEVNPMPLTTSGRHVRLFKNGRSQAVRIPREFELPGSEAILSRDRNGNLILEPVRKTKLADLLSSWKPLADAESIPAVEDMPPEPVNM